MEKLSTRNSPRAFAMLLLFAVADPSIVEIISSTVQVPAHDYRAFSTHIATWPAVYNATFEVASGPPIQITLLARSALNDFARGRPYEPLVEIAARRSGKFVQAVPAKGDYDILLVNDSESPAMVRLEAAIQFARQPDVAVYLSPTRKITIIVASLLFFALACTWSALRLRTAMRRPEQ